MRAAYLVACACIGLGEPPGAGTAFWLVSSLLAATLVLVLVSFLSLRRLRRRVQALASSLPNAGSFDCHPGQKTDAAHEPEPGDSPTCWIDLASFGHGDLDRLAAARLDHDVFPRLATLMDREPPAESPPAGILPTDANTPEPAAGEPAGADLIHGTADADQMTDSLVQQWTVAVRAKDLLACRAIFRLLSDTLDSDTLTGLRTEMDALTEEVAQSLRQAFASSFQDRDYEGMLHVGAQICNMLPDSPLAAEFQCMEAVLRRLKHRSRPREAHDGPFVRPLLRRDSP